MRVTMRVRVRVRWRERLGGRMWVRGRVRVLVRLRAGVTMPSESRSSDRHCRATLALTLTYHPHPQSCRPDCQSPSSLGSDLKVKRSPTLSLPPSKLMPPLPTP